MRPFTDILRDIRNGRVVDEATEQLLRLVEECQRTGKGGTLTVTLGIKPEKGDSIAVGVTAKVKSSLPTADLPSAVFFIDKDGGLVRSDPTQRELFSATLTGTAAPVAAV